MCIIGFIIILYHSGLFAWELDLITLVPHTYYVNCYLKVILYFIPENNFVCDCNLKWVHALRNGTKSQNTRDSLDTVTCKSDPPIVSAAYNKMSDPNKAEYSQDILHAGLTIETLNDEMNFTVKKNGDIKAVIDVSDDIVKKSVKRNVLKIPPETLPCPREVPKTTLSTPYVIDSVIPIQNEMKTYRFHEMNSGNGPCTRFSIVVLWCACFAFFFT